MHLLDVAAPNAEHQVILCINGASYEVRLHPFATLLDALREELQLTGTKMGCGTGSCGTCTVLMDGRRVKSCLTLAAMCDDHRITTIEGLAKSDSLHPLQFAFIEHDAFQCGFCTPGQIMAAAGYLRECHSDLADPQRIREQMSGNLCRCGAYPNIVAAIASVAINCK
jgi:xanthine dehydrogenase YagT iron-sulfur-binding subunit